MSNTNTRNTQASTEAPNTPSPIETKPAPQQNQGDGKPGTDKPEQQK